MMFVSPKKLREKIVYYIFLLALLLIIMVALDRSGLLMFFYIIFMPLGVVGVFWVTKIIFKKWYFSLLASTIVVGLIVYDFVAPHIRMAQYCEEYNAGVHIYETAENVDGFYAASDYIGCDYTCAGSLLTSKYDFIETRLDDEKYHEYVQSMGHESREAAKYRGFATDPGFYRFYIIPHENDPKCEIFEQYLQLRWKKRYENGFGRLDEYQGICIATEKIKNLQSKYAFFRERFDGEVDGIYLLRSHEKITERSSGKILAEKNSVYFKPDMFFHAHEVLTHVGCSTKDKKLKISDVLLRSEKGDNK